MFAFSRVRHREAIELLLAGTVFTVLAGVGSVAANATTYTVTTLVEDGTACTLRNALMAAASDTPVGDCPAGSSTDVINITAVGFLIFNGGDVLLDPVAEGHSIDITISGPNSNPASLVVALGSHRFADLVSGARLTLENLTFSGGETLGRGGVVRSANSDLTLFNTVFSFNTAATAGGAVSFTSTTTKDLLVEDCAFTNNDATLVAGASSGFIGGGGLIVQVGASSSVYIRRTDFEGNTALHPDLAYNGEGGGLYLTTFDNATAVLEETRFEANGVQGNGALGGGARLFASDSSSIEVLDLVALDNFIRTNNSTSPGTLGAGIQAGAGAGSVITLDRILALGNDSDDHSSPNSEQIAIAAVGGTATLRNAVVAQGLQNGIYARSSEHESSGGELRLVNVTATDNAIFGTIANRQDSSADLAIGNSLYWNNGTAGLSIVGGIVSISSSSTLVDPQFVDPANDDYRLQPTSPARDAGSAGILGIGSSDLDGNQRVAGPQPDQGAYEYGSVPFSSLFSDGFESGDVGAWI